VFAGVGLRGEHLAAHRPTARATSSHSAQASHTAKPTPPKKYVDPEGFSSGPDDIDGWDPEPRDQIPPFGILTADQAEAKANQYHDSVHLWPVKPSNIQHFRRGSFNDPRPTHPKPTFHFGVDINVDDSRPEAGAPRGRTHRVVAVESGIVHIPPRNENANATDKKLMVGHFAYWHADWVGVVKDGQYVRAGQTIAWTAKNNWHVHLSEWQWRNGKRVWVNPLRPGGKVGPKHDYKKPNIHEVLFRGPSNVRWQWFRGTKRAYAADTGSRLAANNLHGKVDMRIWVGDPPAVEGWIATKPPLYVERHPYEVKVDVRRRSNGKLILSRDYINDVIATEKTTIGKHYAPGTVQNLPAKLALDLYPKVSGGNKYFLRGFDDGSSAYWDTSHVRDGAYQIDITVKDDSGNVRRARRNVVVNNDI
jgi:hypothetical protein